MKLMTVSLVGMILAFSLLAGACAKPPTEEMNSAIEAVTRAENDPDVVLYAANVLIRAKNALGRMRVEAESKNYEAAKTYAAEATTEADRAITEARIRAARAREEAAAALRDLKPAIAETEQGIQAAQSANLALDFDAINEEFDSVRLTAEQAEVAFIIDRYQDSMEKSWAAKAGLTDINQKLADTAMATTRKK